MTSDHVSLHHRLSDFWTLSPAQRAPILLDAILETHTWHYERNLAYRRMVKSRGLGRQIGESDLARILRPTAQTFKSYIGVIGTPFPEERPQAFLNWLADQISVPLPRDRLARFQAHYPSLEKLLLDFEAIYADFGFEVTTSSGTSGRATIMLRDRETIDLAVDCFLRATLAVWGVGGEHNAIFMMPFQTRIAMARTARIGAERLGMQATGRAHFTIPFPAEPDRVRVRTGRTFRPGWRGLYEKRFVHPFVVWMDEHYVQPQATAQAISLLVAAGQSGEPTLLFGSLVQIHVLSQELQKRGFGQGGRMMRLPAGSLVGTGGGLKQYYPFSPAQIRHDIQAVLQLDDGGPIPIRDVMGMAEANWAAPQCEAGNYHVPPWVYAVALDDDDEMLDGADTTGMLAFFDPLGGGHLFPSFFKTADQVHLVNGTASYCASQRCTCGRDTPYLLQGTIRRMDLFDEAGCAGQL